MSGLLRCAHPCGRVLHDPRPRNLSPAERVAQKTYERRDPEAQYTADEVDALLDRINRDRPAGRAWPVEAAKALGLPRSMHGVWTLRGDVAVLLLRCPSCRARYGITDDNMRRRAHEATERGEDVILTNRDR